MVGEWTPVRYISHEQRCAFCGATILRGKPGASSGERGTKAYFRRLDEMRGEWECLACRSEGQDALVAWEKEREVIAAHVRPMMREGERFDVLVDTRLRVIQGGRALWEAIRGGTVASLKIVAVPVVIGREMESGRGISSSVADSAKGSTSGGITG